ncbi:hypothetical protein MKI84_07025 [Ancylobacter sp. A5.8]|nr:hypothetical protein [Ancylobacter gelatini]MCJ8142666.1 hypothetical protein [Ancylobacter gelatini]
MAQHKKPTEPVQPHGAINSMRSWETKHWVVALLILLIAIGAFLASWD